MAPDGWRGRNAHEYTFDNVRRCSQGFADYLLSQGQRDEWVVVGYDKRFQSEYFAIAVAEDVLAANGLRVYLTQEATPTPVISFSVVNKGAVGAVNITASHNPAVDNGFKVRNEFGGAIDPTNLKLIEAKIPQSIDEVKQCPLSESIEQERVVYHDPAPEYINHIKRLINLEPIKRAGLNILIDPMWGNGAGWFPRLLNGGKTQVSEIHNIRNPIFPEMSRPEPNSSECRCRAGCDFGAQG